MIGVFSHVVKQSRLTRVRLVSIDNPAFRVHYRLTFAMLLACTALVCSRQYIGEHIRCVASGVPGNVVDTFCFFTTTYTLPGANNTAHPGVGPHAGDGAGARVQHAYYQWVPFVLFAQALLFCVPHWLWRAHEAGTIALLVDGLQRLYLKADGGRDVVVGGGGSRKIPSAATRWAKVRDVVNHLDTVSRFRVNRNWAAALVGCELLNLVNVLLQLELMDRFLGGQFYTYGARALGDDGGTFDRVFPKMTKCDFRKYGPSGTIQTHDALCVMALNIINEKIYAVLWFWFMFVLIPVSVSALVWRAVQYCLHASEPFNRLLLREASPGVRLDPVDLAVVARQTAYSDWLFLYYLSGNMDGDVFRDLLHSLATGLRKEPGGGGSRASGSDADDLLPLGKTPL